MTTRPVILIPVWGFSALGFSAAANFSCKKNVPGFWHETPFHAYLLMVIFSLSVAAVYIINQLADIEVDKKNGGLPLIASGIVSIKTSTVFMIGCVLGSIVLPLLLKQPFIAMLSVVSVILGAVYSVKPFRFSGVPVLDFLSNAAGYGVIAFAAGWVSAGRELFDQALITASLPYFFLMAAGSISSTLPDMTGDRTDGKNTTAVVMGKARAHILAMFFLVSALVAGYLKHDLLAVGCALLSLPLYMAFLCNLKSNALMEATYKIGGAACMVAAFFTMPLFLPLSLMVFFVTLLYFRVRHGVRYPSLLPVK